MTHSRIRLAAKKALCSATAVALLIGQPALADVKSGVDAWSRGDYPAAVKEWREPALKGDADAQFNMGQAYKMGRGVKTDLDIALDWYRKAAGQGHLQAEDSIGHLLHYKGNITESLPYLQTSSERGEPRAQYLLATELFNGVNINKDWIRAYALMTRASSAGMALASRSLAQMDQHISLEDRQRGIVMAGELEKRASSSRAQRVAGFPINTAPPARTGRPVDLPPSQSYPQEPSYPGVGYPEPAPEPKVQPRPAPVRAPAPKVTAVKPAPTPKVAAPAPKVAASGNYRIQLGAFGNEANARALWNRLEAQVASLSALQPYLQSTGSVVRLQAGPFSTRGAAEASCTKVKAAGQACLVVSK